MSRHDSKATGDAAGATPVCRGARIAVTGGSGFIGRWLLERLLAEGMLPRALWRSEHHLAPAGVEICRGSLESPESLARLVTGCDGVVHLAAALRGRRQAQFDEVNVAGTERLARAVARHAPSARAVAVSSLAAREPQLSWYAGSKAAGEQVLTAAAELWTILRPPAVYGPGDPALSLLWRSLARGWLPRIGPPEARFSLLYVADLCEAILRLLRHPSSAGGILPLHDGRPRGYSFSEVAAICAARRGAAVRTLPLPRGLLVAAAAVNLRVAALRGTEPMLIPGKVRELVHGDWVCDNSQLERVLAWSPATLLDECLTRLPGWERYS